MRDVRKRAKAERQFYQRNDLQTCIVCGRLFCRRKDTVCSMSCKAIADAAPGAAVSEKKS
jgi:hypothetical protein